MALLVALAVASCGPARRAELERQPDDLIRATLINSGPNVVCEAAMWHPGWYGPRTVAIAQDEVRRMDLGDCTEAHRQCVSMGFAGGTDGYLKCRAMVGQQAVDDAEIRAAAVQQSGPTQSDRMLDLAQRLLAGPPVTQTTCLPFGGGLSCTTQ